MSKIQSILLKRKEGDLLQMSSRKDFDVVYTLSSKDPNGNPMGSVQRKAFNFLIGQPSEVIKKDKDPSEVNEQLKRVEGAMKQLVQKVEEQSATTIEVSALLQEALEDNARMRRRIEQLEQGEEK